MSAARKFMVFDVESIGLHGEGYAVGWVLVDETGKELRSARYACPPSAASGSAEGREWVYASAPDLEVNRGVPRQVREAFWRDWLPLKAEGVLLAADVAWPVEAHFLIDCVRNHEGAEWHGPYPLVDISSVRLAVGLDPLSAEERLPSELPAHDPLADARQSARLLIEALAAAAEGDGPPPGGLP